MGLSLSVEVNVPDTVAGRDIVAVGQRCAPPEWRSGMTAQEALQWAFSDAGGVNMLSQLGITWDTIVNGRTS